MCLSEDRRYSSLGNHDVLGGIQGVNEQIAYTNKHPGWYLPARCALSPRLWQSTPKLFLERMPCRTAALFARCFAPSHPHVR